MRLPGLDLLRASAITLVMTQHALELLVQAPDRWRPWFNFGRFGVDLFFRAERVPRRRHDSPRR